MNNRSLPIAEWPEADRNAWAAACRPALRLNAGGAASYLSETSKSDYANRYGAFLGFLQRQNNLSYDVPAGAQVTPKNVAPYLTDLQTRVRSVTTYNAISHLRRVARLLAPDRDFAWLYEIEKDLALMMEPKSKLHRFVLTEGLVKAGLTMIVEAQRGEKDPQKRGRRIRNGLMIALLAVRPKRLRNFAALELGRSFRQVDGSWWIVLSRKETKSRRIDEQKVPEFLNSYVELYLAERKLLADPDSAGNFLWISATTGAPMTKKAVGALISKITFETLGVDVSPHLFRTSAGTTAAIYIPALPALASALLGHTGRAVTEEHYIRATSLNAATVYSAIVERLIEGDT